MKEKQGNESWSPLITRNHSQKNETSENSMEQCDKSSHVLGLKR